MYTIISLSKYFVMVDDRVIELSHLGTPQYFSLAPCCSVLLEAGQWPGTTFRPFAFRRFTVRKDELTSVTVGIGAPDTSKAGDVPPMPYCLKQVENALLAWKNSAKSISPGLSQTRNRGIRSGARRRRMWWWRTESSRRGTQMFPLPRMLRCISKGPIVAGDTARLCFVAHYSVQAFPQSTGIWAIASVFNISK